MNTRLKHSIIEKYIYDFNVGLLCFFFFLFCYGSLFRKNCNTFNLLWAGYVIPGCILPFLTLWARTHKNSGICAWLHCCTPMRLFSYSCLSAAFLCGVFYSTWTTQKVCTKMDLLNLVNSQLCVDVVMYFWGRKGNTKGTLSFSKTLIRNGLPFLLQSCKISSLFGALCEFPYSSLPSLLTTNLKLADSWRADSELFWPCLL